MRRPLALRYRDLSPEGLQLDLEFIDHVLNLVFINDSVLAADRFLILMICLIACVNIQLQIICRIQLSTSVPPWLPG